MVERIVVPSTLQPGPQAPHAAQAPQPPRLPQRSTPPPTSSPQLAPAGQAVVQPQPPSEATQHPAEATQHPATGSPEQAAQTMAIIQSALLHIHQTLQTLGQGMLELTQLARRQDERLQALELAVPGERPRPAPAGQPADQSAMQAVTEAPPQLAHQPLAAQPQALPPGYQQPASSVFDHEQLASSLGF